MSTVITSIDHRSPAERAGVRTGERLVSIGGHAVEDVLDYRFFGYDRDPELVLESLGGSRRTVRVKKPEAAELGLNFETYLMDEPRPCSNHCLFCFVDQMAPGCRDTLYFKDDDARLSFLMGNYITLTNLSPREVQRIIDLRISPINVSVHATDPRLRSVLLGNKAGGESLEAMRRFGQAGIVMNGQIVLCKGLNDGEELERTIRDLAGFLPYLQSVSVVPVGLTCHREGLYSLEPFTREDAIRVLDQIHGWQERLYRQHGTHFIHAGDEWYLLAGHRIPGEETYDGYLQLENGVGMVRLLKEELSKALAQRPGDGRKREVSIATGKLAAPILEEELKGMKEKYLGVRIRIYPIENRFFGESITVAGLLTGQDLKSALCGKILGEELLLTEHMFKRGEDVFLDDMTLEELSRALQVPVTIVKSDGKALLEAVLGERGQSERGEMI